MKIVSHYLQSIDGVSIYPIITLVIFLSMFISISVWAFKLSKKDVQLMSHVPFEDDELREQKTV